MKVVIDVDGDEKVRHEINQSLTKEKILSLLLASGSWPYIRQRPYNIIARTDKMPKAIFVSTHSTAPYDVDYDFLIKERLNDFQKGIREARRALDDVGKTGKVTLIYAGGVRDGADMAKALALGADAIAIGTGSMIALNCNKDIPEANFEKEMGVKAGECYHCHTGRCPVGVATQDPKLRARLNPDDAALRVYNYLHSMTLEAQLLARACGKTNIHSLEPEDLAALTSEASALAKVPLAGTNYTVGVDNFHKI